MTDPWTERLSDYVDGELSAEERQGLEVHLTTCAECGSVLAGLREVAARARTLADQPPPADLWPGIAARIGGASSMGAPVTAKRAATRRGLLDWLDRRFTITVPQAAAAAAGLVAVAAIGMWLFLAHAPLRPAPATVLATRMSPAQSGGASVPTDTAEAPPTDERTVGPPSPRPAATAATASVTSDDPRYDATIAELQRVLAEERDRLDPKTVKVLETNLAIIDKAVGEARRAVAADPSNVYLRNHLASVMKRKADLLRQATLIAQEQGSEG